MDYAVSVATYGFVLTVESVLGDNTASTTASRKKKVPKITTYTSAKKHFNELRLQYQ